MRYIKKFATVHKSKAFILDDTNTPNISLIEELVASTGGVRTTQKLPPHDYAADYFTIKAEETRKFKFVLNAGTISYSLDYGETWSEPSNNVTTPLVEAGDKILLKGNINYTSQGKDYSGYTIDIFSPTLFFGVDTSSLGCEGDINTGSSSGNSTGSSSGSSSGSGSDSGSGSGSDSGSGSGSDSSVEIDPDLLGKYSIEGNLMSLFYGDGFNTPGTVAAGFAVDEDPTKVPGYDLSKALFCPIDTEDETRYVSFEGDGPFSNLFNYGDYIDNSELISAKHLILPAQILSEKCYAGMFKNCTALTEGPELPVCDFGYEIVYATDCYKEMFKGCKSLTSAPALPATRISACCYESMFEDCTSLVNAPILPATTFVVYEGNHMYANYCYKSMFKGCTSLTTAPALPSTVLGAGCYESMFEGCTSLTTASALPATTLDNRCYYKMFSGCTSLNYIKCLATDLVSNSTTSYWLYNVALKGTFIKASSNNSWQSGYNGIPEDWTVQNA